jgi:SAM-dependent methyltransferase
MNNYQLLLDLHKPQKRQGPGGDRETLKAIDLAGLDRKTSRNTPLKIADLGCGTGASSLILADYLAAELTAVDFLPGFLEELEVRAKRRGLVDQITPLCCSMDELPFSEQDYDLIWSEGAIYNIGFERGLQNWNPYLKLGGLLVISEITWTIASRPVEIQDYWQAAYAEIDLASAKLSLLESNGYSPIGYFTLPESCWLENYYYPLQNNFENFLKQHDNSQDAQDIVAAEKQEIEIYKQYKNYYSYGVYIAKKISETL